MYSNDRKRSRAESAAGENDTIATKPASSAGLGGLRPRTVNTAHSNLGAKNNYPTGESSATNTRSDGASTAVSSTLHTTTTATTTTTPRSQTDGSSASGRSSASQPHTKLGVARGRPHQPYRPPQKAGGDASSLSSVPAAPAPVNHARSAVAPTGLTKSGVKDSRRIGAVTTNSNNNGPGTHAHAARTSAASASPVLSEAEATLRATWKAKRIALEDEVCLLEAQSGELTEETRAVEDAIESMLTEFEDEKRGVEAQHASTVARYHRLMLALRAREDASLAAKQRALDSIDASIETVRHVCQEQQTTQEAIVLTTERREALGLQLATVRAAEAARRAALAQLHAEEERMKDASYGLSGEVRDLVLEMERLKTEKRNAEVAAMETEVTRRELYSLCEELKGSIRVYCRVKGAVNVDAGDATQRTTTTTMPSPSPQPPLPPSPAPPLGATVTSSVTTATDGFDVAEEEEEVKNGDGDGAEDTGSTATTAAVSSPLTTARGGSVESSVSAGVRSTASAQPIARKGPANGGLRSGRSTTRASATATSAAGADDERVDDEESRCLFTFPDRMVVAGDVALAEEVEEVEVKKETLLDANSASGTGVLAGEDVKAGTSSNPTALVGIASEAAKEGQEGLPNGTEAGLPYSSGRAITIHQTRSNATSTGISNTQESFVYDRVFPGGAHQREVYRDVEPLVRNAVDGYRVCVFAYGQTGSGKTFTMEGDLRHTPAAYGVTPRALQTILQRQEELGREGWCYELSCTFIEIYNDVIRDLFQSGSAKYEAAMQQSGNAASYHTIKHSGDRTHITNVSEKKIRNMSEFFALYKQAVEQRSTAKTDLNDKSSRSHCIFTLHITGTNATIRQRSDGVLCLVDLAGSERVNESGVQGKQFKEAVNINRSLLDLGKCIRALRSGAVVPWRNCKLTYLLQNYLGAKGGKMLMIVTVSNLRQHASETINSLRFAARVQETFVGTSVKRVVNMM